MNPSKKIIGIIPARWQSSRFPGKPLANILGKSLIERTYENVKQCRSLDGVVIATDDTRIFDHAKSIGAEVFMTSSTCPTGTDRVWEVADRYFPEAEVIVNIQGDEPCLDPKIVDQLISRLQEDQEAQLTTPVTKITEMSIIHSTSVVKCVFDKEGRVLYFSRSPIPFIQKQENASSYYRHLGVYCFKREALQKFSLLHNAPLQECEDIEALKLLENGLRIHVSIVNEQGIGVDKPEDIKMIEKILCQKENIYSSQEGSSPPWARA